MYKQYIDEIILMVSITLILAIIDTILFFIKVDKEKKDQFMKWFNILGAIIILGIVARELIKLFVDINQFINRL